MPRWWSRRSRDGEEATAAKTSGEGDGNDSSGTNKGTRAAAGTDSVSVATSNSVGGTRWKRLLGLFKVLIVVSVGFTIIVAVSVPVALATKAGVNGVSEVLVHLMDSLGASTKSTTYGYLTTGMSVAFMIADSCSSLIPDVDTSTNTTARLPRESFLEIEEHILSIVRKLDPQSHIRYAYWVSDLGEMSCVSFTPEGIDFQEVRLLDNGTATNQLEWPVTSDGVSPSYPDNYTDIGWYSLLDWFPYEITDYVWYTVSYSELNPEGDPEMIASFFVPYMVNGTCRSFFGVDIRLTDISSYLRKELNVSAHAEAFLTQEEGYLLATSADIPLFIDNVEDALYLASECNSSLISSVTRSVEKKCGTAYDSSCQYPLKVEAVEENGRKVSCSVNYYPLFREYELNWNLIVAIPFNDFTDSLKRHNRLNVTLSALILLILTVFLTVLILGLTNRVAHARLKIHDAELSPDLDLNSGLEKVLLTLEGLQYQVRDRNIRKTLRGVVSQLVGSVNSGKLFAPALSTNMFNRETKEWLQVELGQNLTGDTTPFFCATSTPNTPTSHRLHRTVSHITPHASRPPTPTVSQIDAQMAISLGLYNWSFPIFQFSTYTSHPLVVMGSIIFEPLVLSMSLPQKELLSFFSSVEAMYQDVPFHSVWHAADVLQATYVLLEELSKKVVLSDLEKFAQLIAAAIHDVGHPGLNNSFQVQAETDLAFQYNDQSVLENFHAKTGLSLLNESGLTADMDPSEQKALRSLIISLILATDMSQHWRVVSEFKTVSQHGKITGDGKLLVMKMLMKIADISNVTRSGETMKTWAERMTEEFFLQGDEERKLGFVSPVFMNRLQATAATKVQTQVNFLQLVARPAMDAYNEFCAVPELITNLNSNWEYWNSQLQECSSSAPMKNL
ncbi:3'5'-cyclic nucleotide phosphodiesterase [Pelomyxa schiedti]|nr:3'5'-cyclic nucleotide phosphodiesterase [Pelomyxa schiedti]